MVDEQGFTGDERGRERRFVPARRAFVFLGALAFAGCAAPRRTEGISGLPSPSWPKIPLPPVPPPTGLPEPKPAPEGEIVCPLHEPVPWARPRATWAEGRPDTADMRPMLPVQYVTVHHDGLTPFLGLSEFESKARLELIRVGHRSKEKGFADIGYHYVVDRAGRVWQGRDVTKWQGAHVKNHNEGNVGVMCLGNFCEQRPSAAQVAALNRVIVQLMAYYGVPPGRVRTHKEWAPTECPGPSLQASVDAMRRRDFRMPATA